jgi:hypothetical protein
MSHKSARRLHLPMRQSCERGADAPDLEEVSHANAMRRILRSWLAMGFRRHKGRGLFDCGSLSRTRLDIRAGVRPRFSFRCLENSCVAFEPACLPVQLHRVKLSFSLLPRTDRAARRRAGFVAARGAGAVRHSCRGCSDWVGPSGTTFRLITGGPQAVRMRLANTRRNWSRLRLT